MTQVALFEDGQGDDTFIEPPPSPQTLDETGLNDSFLSDLSLKFLYDHGALVGKNLASLICLPFRIIEQILEDLKVARMVEVTRGELMGPAAFRFQLTDLGRSRAKEALEASGYVGPAPVPLESYIQQCYRQTVTGTPITPEGLASAFSHMVVNKELLDTVGPAVVSGKAVFLYGPPGTGKTTIAQAVGNYMNTSAGEIYVPYALIAKGGIVTVYDPIVHKLADDQADDVGPDAQAILKKLLNEDTVDARWVKIRRPVIITGGELNLDMLDLQAGGAKNVFQMPLHIKANGGVFLIDDFGRQLVSPKELLNRWIYPLESRKDFLQLPSGEKIEIPFEQLTMFSTNMDPHDLVDDAFLRRIRHKIGIYAPDRNLYTKIFWLNVRRLKLVTTERDVENCIDYLYQTYYDTGRRISRPSDARDLLEIVVSICRYQGVKPYLKLDLIIEAARQFIGEF